jgi:hypothetical protein
MRAATIRSNLYPAWYRRSLESAGVEDESENLFSELARRISTLFPAEPLAI